MYLNIYNKGEKPFTCDICGTCFSSKNGLASHKVTHSGEKPHNCEVCGKVFAHKVGLTAHMRVHTGKENICIGNLNDFKITFCSWFLEFIPLHTTSRWRSWNRFYFCFVKSVKLMMIVTYYKVARASSTCRTIGHRPIWLKHRSVSWSKALQTTNALIAQLLFCRSNCICTVLVK